MKRDIKISVTNFLTCQGKYLLLHRSKTSKVDADRLNGIGGKVEPGENYLAAAIRETEEETGYTVSVENCHFHGMLKIEGGYPEDWVVAFFTIAVESPNIPKGSHIPEGELLWLNPDDVLKTEIEMVDDLHFLFPKIVAKKELFFATAQVNSQEKIDTISIDTLSL